MSFGFSVGDCILLIDIARTQYNNCVAAGPEYHEIAREVKTLYNVLELLHNEISKASSPLLRGEQAFTAQLAPAVNGCKHILEDLQTLLAKYEGLSSNGKAVNPTKKLWHKIRFSTKIQALGEVKSKVIYYTTTISVLLDVVQLRVTGRLEDKLDATNTAMIDGFQSIKLVVVEEVLKAKSLTQRQSTASLLSLSTYNEDDKEVWKEFRRDLIAKGFKSNQLDRHKDMLQAYMLKLEQSGVLDEVGMASSVPSSQKNVFHSSIEMSPSLQPIEEEEDLARPPPVYQQLDIETSAAQSSESESPPPQEYEETLSASESIMPRSICFTNGFSTFLHTVIRHAISEGPQAFQQTLDLYPQLLQDPYLDSAISAESIPSVRNSLRTTVATARQSESVKEVTSSQTVALEEVRRNRDHAAKEPEGFETKRAIGLPINMKAQPTDLREDEEGDFPVPFLTCSRCAKPHIEYELHYNCDKCSDGNWNMCLSCYRGGEGCLHWFGFGYRAWTSWKKLSPGAERPHMLTANRYTVLEASLDGGDGPRALATPYLHARLQSGTFCSNCVAWAMECYWRCELCNAGDWGFCNTCVNQGKCCTHPLLPLTYNASESGTASANLSFVQNRPSSATILTAPGLITFGNFKPLTFRTLCDICRYPIQPNLSRYHCFSCTSSNFSNYDVDSREMEEEILRQIREERLLDDLDLENLDVNQEDQISERIAEAFRRRQRERALPGDFDICKTCYSKLEASNRISAENGHRGWRRCLKGHRMIIVGFEDSCGVQRRVILNDLVGGRGLQAEPSQMFAGPGFNLERWSWQEGVKMRPVATNVMVTAPKSTSSAQMIDFPPDGGTGMTARAIWSWYPKEGDLESFDELLFPSNAEVREVVNVNGDWFYGVYMGVGGLFPAPYVKILTKEENGKDVVINGSDESGGGDNGT